MSTKTAAKKETISKKDSFKSAPFAVIETGGKQYKVSEGQIVKIEKISGKHEEGSKITFDQVLAKDDGKAITLGDPTIKGAKVEAKFIETARNKKIVVMKFKNKTRSFKKNGHKQPYTKVEITKI